jgi:hypothetical protein
MKAMKTLIAALALGLGAAHLAAKADPTPGPSLGQRLGLDAPASPTAQAGQTPAAADGGAAAVTPAPTPVPLFQAGQTAVAYQVGEHIFGHENAVTGRNQDVTVTVEAKGDLRRVVVSAAANGFKSDRSMRDGRVAGTLGGKGLLLISTDWFPAVSLTALTQGPSHLAGTLTIKGSPAAISLSGQGDGKTVLVQALTSFKELGLSPPSMMLMGEVHQPLTLSAQIQLQSVQGLQ